MCSPVKDEWKYWLFVLEETEFILHDISFDNTHNKLAILIRGTKSYQYWFPPVYERERDGTYRKKFNDGSKLSLSNTWP